MTTTSKWIGAAVACRSAPRYVCVAVYAVVVTEVSVYRSVPTSAPVVAFSNSLGTTLAMWDRVVPALRGRFRVLRYDTRGHGASPTAEDGISAVGGGVSSSAEAAAWPPSHRPVPRAARTTARQPIRASEARRASPAQW